MNDQNDPVNQTNPIDDQAVQADDQFAPVGGQTAPADAQISAEEQELARVLDDINQQVDDQAATTQQQETEAQLEQPSDEMIVPAEATTESETPEIEPAPQFADLNKQLEGLSEKMEQAVQEKEQPEQAEQAEQPEVEVPAVEPVAQIEPEMPARGNNSDLEQLKKSALNDLRPLVDKLNLSNEEKFEIQLLLIRSTDDQTLLDPTYEAARAIEDEQKRAQALLNVIKEVDYFATKK